MEQVPERWVIYLVEGDIVLDYPAHQQLMKYLNIKRSREMTDYLGILWVRRVEAKPINNTFTFWINIEDLWVRPAEV